MTTTVLYLSLYPGLGGAEKALLQLLAALDRARVTPLVALPAAGLFEDDLRAAGVETVVEPFPTPPLHGLLAPSVVLALRRGSERLCRLARDRGVSLVHCGDLLAVLLMWPLLHAGTGLVYQVNYLGGRGRRVALRGLVALPRRIVVAWSQAQRTLLQGDPVTRGLEAVVVHPGLDPAALEQGDGAAFRQATGVAAEAPLVGMLARFDAWKGHHVFLQAARQVHGQRPDVRFVVVGGALNADWLPHVARYEKGVRAAARADGLEAVVTFVPHRHDVANVLAALDVLVCPSLHEPFGMVVIEGMAAGRAVLASDSGGPVEILRHGETGLLFPTGDPQALAQALVRLLDAPLVRQQLGQAARQAVALRFHRARYAADMHALYDRLA